MNQTGSLPTKYILLALVVVIVWGLNFIAIFVGLKELPPFLFCTLRFLFSSIPFIFFFPRPKVPLLTLIGYGLFNFAMQFGLMFSGIHMGLSPGLASLVVQVQVFFSIALAFIFFKEKPGILKIVGSLVSFLGIGLVAMNVGGDVTIIGLILCILAALSWAGGNMFTKKMHAESPLALVVWGNFISFPFMLVASFLMDGQEEIISSISGMSWEVVLALAYVVYMSTHIGYGLWGTLLQKFPTTSVVPFTLLVPIVGFLGTAIALNERLYTWKLWASLLIMGGLLFNLFEKRILKAFKSLKTKEA